MSAHCWAWDLYSKSCSFFLWEKASYLKTNGYKTMQREWGRPLYCEKLNTQRAPWENLNSSQRWELPQDSLEEDQWGLETVYMGLSIQLKQIHWTVLWLVWSRFSHNELQTLHLPTLHHHHWPQLLAGRWLNTCPGIRVILRPLERLKSHDAVTRLSCVGTWKASIFSWHGGQGSELHGSAQTSIFFSLPLWGVQYHLWREERPAAEGQWGGRRGPCCRRGQTLPRAVPLPAISLLRVSDAGSFAALPVSKGSPPPCAALTQITALKLLKKKKDRNII